MSMDSRVVLLLLVGLSAAPARGATPKVGDRVDRRGDEIVACGQLFHTTAPVVLWMDPGGYDAYRVERRFAPLDKSSWEDSKSATLTSPNRFGARRRVLSPAEMEKFRGGGWDLASLQNVVDQFVIHFDVAGTSRRCFEVLHDQRGLSVQFMLDLDGTIYQTLDAKEGAWHATIANSRSIGIEIANVGAYEVGQPAPFDKWYRRGPDGRVQLTPPAPSGLRHPSEVLRPARNEPITGTIQGQKLRQYDLTPEQYDSLIKLTATLCTVFPKIKCDYPRDAAGRLIPHKLPDDQLKRYQGVLGHYHVQTNKVDPGPAFQWDKVIDGARQLMTK